MSYPGPRLPSRLQKLLHRPLAAVRDLVYPNACTACSQPIPSHEELSSLEAWFCPKCIPLLPWAQAPYCQRCGEMYDGAIQRDFQCQNCEGLSYHFDFAISACSASDPVREMIHRYKYGDQLYLRGALSALLAHTLEEKRLSALDLGSWLLVPVPLHAAREAQRGYNQSWELCARLSQRTGIPALSVLERARETPSQARLTRHQRLENLRGAFRMCPQRFRAPAPDVRGRHILLVDDVFTTGATTSECARVLKQQGQAAQIIVLTVARG